MKKSVLDRVKRKAVSSFRRLNVMLKTRHISGPKKIHLKNDEAALVCMLKDGGYYLEKFLEHHRSIGINHFLIIDNGSSDSTKEIAKSYSDVSLYENTLPVYHYECLLRSIISRRVISGGWFLFSDSDELFEMPRGEMYDISEFLSYCNANGFRGIICQVLDLYSDLSLQETSAWPYGDCVAAFDNFSLNEIRKFEYHDDQNIAFSWYLRENEITNHDVKVMFGGVRSEVFGENCCLTTHRIVKNDPDVDLYSHPHASGNIRIADFTALLRHYKFAGTVIERDRQQLAQGIWGHEENKSRLSAIGDGADFVILPRVSHKFTGTEKMIENGFLVCSEAFDRRFPGAGKATTKKM